MSNSTSLDPLSFDNQLEHLLDLPESERNGWIQANVEDPNLRVLLMQWSQQMDARDWLTHGVESVLQIQPAWGDDATTSAQWPSQNFGRYRLLRPCGEGGASVVWLAERADETAQRVAIKCLKRGLIDMGGRERFLTEQKFLSRLTHPHIVRLLDADVSTESVPFTVMEWVDGQTLMAHAQTLSLVHRLQLFLQLCDAVAFAHRNLILHRDLKPNNVMVDRSGCVKLLDFGIGQMVTSSGKADATHSMAMTPAYAAPEQLRGENLSTAVDVYGLGLILFELLTNQKAFEHLDRRHNPEAEIKLPSLCLSNLNTLVLTHQVQGDLDAIARTATAIEPGRRYASVDELRADLQRHLEHKPIRARKPSIWYVTSRFAQRHRIALVAATLVLCSWLLATALVWNAGVAARQEAQRSKQKLEFVESLFRNESREHSSQDLPSTAELLERGALRAESELRDDPIGQLQVLSWIGRAYRHSDRPQLAESTLLRAQALVRKHKLQANSLAQQIAIDLLDVRIQGDLKSDEALWRDWNDLQKQRFNSSRSERLLALQRLHIDLLTKANRFAEADRVAAAVLQEFQQDPQSNALQQSEWLMVRSRILSALSQHAEAAALALTASDTLDRLPHAPARLRVDARNAHALALAWNQDAKAETYLREALAFSQSLSQEPNLASADIANALGNTLATQGKFDEARKQLEWAKQIRVRWLGATHQQALDLQGDLALLDRRAGRFSEAERAYREMLETFNQGEPNNTPARHAILLGNLADVLIEQNKLQEAHDLSERALNLRREFMGTDSVGPAYYYLWRIALERGQLDDALQLAQKGLREIGEQSSPHADQALLTLLQADTERRLGRAMQSRASLNLATALNFAALPNDHLRWGLIHLIEAQWQLAFGTNDAARIAFQRAEPFLKRNLGLSIRQREEIARVQNRI